MGVRPNRPARPRRCRDCGAALIDAGLLERLFAQLPGRGCGRCRKRQDRSPAEVIIASGDAQQNPFSLFIPENALGAASTAAASPTEPRAPSPMSFVPRRLSAPGAPALLVAFGLGLTGGAAPLLWLESFSTQPSTSAPAIDATTDPAPTAAPRRSGPSTASHSSAVILPAATSSTLASGVHRSPFALFLESATAAGAAGVRPPAPDPSPAVRRTVPARSRVRTVRYSGRKTGAFRGALAVSTTPSGARISLDGISLGPTPIRIDRVPAGSHVLRLEAEGRRVSASAIQVVADRTTRVTVALERSPSLP